MTTNKQLRDWLEQFPDDVRIQVVTSVECNSAWHTDTSVYREGIDLPSVSIETLTSWGDYPNVEFDVRYDYVTEKCVEIKSITLGKPHN